MQRFSATERFSIFDRNELPTYKLPRGDHSDLPSVKTTAHETGAKESLQYTGGELVGIAQMHKSNAVPVVRGSEMAEATAKMRRN